MGKRENLIYGNLWELMRPIWSQNSLSGQISSQIWNQRTLIHTYPCILLKWPGPFWQPWRPQLPPNSLKGQIWLQIWNKWPRLSSHPCAYSLYVLGPFCGIWGHYKYNLQTTSEVKSKFRFEIYGQKYTSYHVLVCFDHFCTKNGKKKKKELY